ncbi:MAG: hypothetical protein DWC06_03585 [Candidatus Poseidoniales archaeon]|nr:hypothetical protein [Candidatus Poseidoniales archaeon]RJV01161.1 MAG: hypothetical protein DWC06_03585 [Candidatus Poseidoniales archaeon]|tara:strand:- start:653 stop:913 length:261 start_codon:yes stop_codon:yes gene_type:complete
MDWRPSGYQLSTSDLVHAIFDGNSDAGKLLVKASMGEVELFAAHKSWNAILWLITNTLKRDGSPVYSGAQLGDLKASLPIVWRQKL